jgi:CRP-like cAMP-binding protein
MMRVGNRGPGDTFGELALRSECIKRAAMVVAVEDSIFGVMNKQTYRLVLGKIEARKK